MWTIGPLTFVLPWALGGAIVLPLLWWLLKTTPPSPRRQIFPAIRLLAGLSVAERTAARTPLWLVALRILLAILVILAASHPVIDGGPAPAGGSLLLVIDDGWAAARFWAGRETHLQRLLADAERSGRSVRLLRTAPPADGSPVTLSPPMAAADARAQLQAAGPQPWPVDRSGAARALAALPPGPQRVVWITDGLASPDDRALISRLRSAGRLEMVSPPSGAEAKVLLPPSPGARGVEVRLLRVQGPGAEATVRVRDGAGRTLGLATARFAAGEGAATVSVAMPDELRNRAARIDIDGEDSAGATVLLDDRWRRHPVGLVEDKAGGGASPLLDDLFYMERALEPFSDLHRGTVADLVRRDLAMIVLPDDGALSDEDAQTLSAWVEGGGVLLRLAGPKLAQNPDGLLPVRLRGGGRMLGGAMSWTRPMALAPIEGNSPFSGLPVPSDLKVATQLLAEPGPDLDQHAWARLADGTPLVTGTERGKGWLVLIHTTVGPAWSNLGLTGLLPGMAQRLLALSRGFAGQMGDHPLAPDEVLDGFGRLGPPGGRVEALLPSGADGRPVAIGPAHPPGYYGDASARRALNLGPAVAALTPLAVPSGIARSVLGSRAADIDLQPPLLMAALFLLFIDLLIVLALRGHLRLPRRGLGMMVAIVAAIGVMAGDGPSRAADLDRQAALETRLAYVLTGQAQVDDESRAGLLGLSQLIQRRTTASFGEPAGVDVARDPLMLFPLLYWPVTDGQGALTAAARDRVNDYMRKGGMILFDTRDLGQAGPGRLRTLTQGLDIPPLAAVTEEHVLSHSFYILRSMPGRLDGAPVYVAAEGDPANDNVSPVVIGAHDWAGAWAVDRRGDPLFAVVPGGEQQREMAFRFGVNLVMYALTGSYKADQVHLPAILERLKR
ncbi:MAG: DUF4159 domain-containing protein [Telmatospirillum sp.]|nr:DUF4159 domain-containing protein [Telmatospirillum sp.]